MDFKYLPLSEANKADGLIVVIDVLRAFTTAAYAFDKGAERIIPVASISEALNIKEKIPGSLVMGETEGHKPESFDFGNSPAEIASLEFTNKTLIQRTSAGTQGLVKSKTKMSLLAASFVVAKATSEYLKRSAPEIVSFIITGDSIGRDGDEDLACAEYIAALVDDKKPSPDEFTSRVLTSSVGQSFLSGERTYLSKEDIMMSLRHDSFNFVLDVKKDSDFLVMRSKPI